VGPFDLALSLGEAIGSPALGQAIQQINDTARRQGLATVSVAPTAEAVSAASDAGDNMVIFGADRLFFTHGLRVLLAAAGISSDKTAT